MHVIICGGRQTRLGPQGELWLDALHAATPIQNVYHGAAPGIDTDVSRWARAHQIPTQAFPAEWGREGPPAGPRRNTKMLRALQHDFAGQQLAVIAFPGGAGTADMCKQARAATLTILEAPEETCMPEMIAPDTKPARVQGVVAPPAPADIPEPPVPESLVTAHTPQTAQDAPQGTQEPTLPPTLPPLPDGSLALLQGFCQHLLHAIRSDGQEYFSAGSRAMDQVWQHTKQCVDELRGHNEHALYQFSDALLKLQEHGLAVTDAPYQVRTCAADPQGFPVEFTVRKADKGALVTELAALLTWLGANGYTPPTNAMSVERL